MEVKGVPSMGWTQRSAAVSVLLAMEEHRKHAGQRVVALREARGWNQEDLAHHADLSTKTVSRFENGRHEGRRATVRAIAKALKVSEAEIVGDPPDPLGLKVRQDDPQLEQIRGLLSDQNDKLNRILELLNPSPNGQQDRDEFAAALEDRAEQQPPEPEEESEDPPEEEQAG